MKRKARPELYKPGPRSDHKHSDLENTIVEEQPSDYVSALVRYDSFKLEKDVHSTSKEIFNEAASEYYPSILNVNPAETLSGATSNFEGLSNLIRARSFEIMDASPDSELGCPEIAEEYDITLDHENNCDVCYGPLADVSVSTCKMCRVASHTNCLLNSCNTITELTPKPRDDSDPSERFKHTNYTYTCKICLLKVNPIKRPRCAVCNLQGGIFNYTDRLYYHPFCVYYSYDVLYPYFNNSLMLSNSTQFKLFLNTLASASARDRVCKLCGDHQGVPVKCKYANCTTYVHSRCIVSTYRDDMNRKSPRKLKEVTQCWGLVICLMIKYDTKLGKRKMLFKGSFCSEHMTKKFINYAIYKQLVNQAILAPKNRTTYSKYKHIIDAILNEYFNSTHDRLNFNIHANIKIPTIDHTAEVATKKRKLNDIIEDIKNKLMGTNDVIRLEARDHSGPREELMDDEVVVPERAEKAAEAQPVPEKPADNKKKDDKDKKEEEDLKVQKVLWQKFDIFNPLAFNPFTSQKTPRAGPNAPGSAATASATKKVSQPQHCDADNSSLTYALLYNRETKNNLLPLNSILFDNIKTNKELSLCYQQKILTSCSGVIEYLNVIAEKLATREDDETLVYVLFENAISNYLLVYAVNKKFLNTASLDDVNVQMQHDLKSVLTNNLFRDNTLKDSALFSNINVYGIKDDVKYIHSILSSSAPPPSTPGSKSKGVSRRLKLVHYIKLTTFESELLKKSVLELRNANYMKLIVLNNTTSIHQYGGTGIPLPNATMEEKYINYIDWSKIINNIKNLYERNDPSTPLKYDEYRLLTHLNPDLKRDMQYQGGAAGEERVSYIATEYTAIESELDEVNKELVQIKNRLHENMLKHCSENLVDQENVLNSKRRLSEYESNEYYYYVLYNISKLFSPSNKTLNLPNLESLDQRSRSALFRGVQFNQDPPADEGVEEESRYCQICYNEEENNINVLVKCARCLIVVHKYCYKVPVTKMVRNNEYLCNRCEYEKKQLSSQYQSNYKKFSILCSICRRGSGPLTRAKDDWYHPFCYLILTLTSNRTDFFANRNDSADEALEVSDLGALGVHDTHAEFNEGESVASNQDSYDNCSDANMSMDTVAHDDASYSTTEDGLEYANADLALETDRDVGLSCPLDTSVVCVVCGIHEGVLLDCNVCANKFHPFCAYFQGFQFRMHSNSTLPGSTKSILITCNDHFPPEDRESPKLRGESEGSDSEGDDADSAAAEQRGSHSQQSQRKKRALPKDLQLIMMVINARYKRYINRDVNDTIYDKDKKKRIIHNTPTVSDIFDYALEFPEDVDMTCNVCYKPNGDAHCTVCYKYVHRNCYPLKIQTNFKCDFCANTHHSKDKKAVYCHVCLNNDGILLKQADEVYYHISCKMIFNCADTGDADVFYQPDPARPVPPELSKGGKLTSRRAEDASVGCDICSDVHGFMAYCYKKNCTLKFHPNCATSHKLIMEPYFTAEGMKYIALCHEHSLLHNTVGSHLKLLLKLRVQLLMNRDVFHDMYQQNLVLKAILRKRKEIYNRMYPLDKIYE